MTTDTPIVLQLAQMRDIVRAFEGIDGHAWVIATPSEANNCPSAPHGKSAVWSVAPATGGYSS